MGAQVAQLPDDVEFFYFDYYVFRVHIQRKGSPVNFCILMLEAGDDQFFVMKRGGRRYKHLFKWLGGNTIKSQSTAKVEFKDAPETRTIQPKPRAKRTREPKPQYSAGEFPIASQPMPLILECRHYSFHEMSIH